MSSRGDTVRDQLPTDKHAAG